MTSDETVGKLIEQSKSTGMLKHICVLNSLDRTEIVPLSDVDQRVDALNKLEPLIEGITDVSYRRACYF